jgi:PAS domain S-box-containing protein
VDSLVPSPLDSTALRIDLESIRAILPQLIDALSDAVVVVDRDQRIVAANRRYVESFGVGHSAIVGCKCQDAINCAELRADPTRDHCVIYKVLNFRRPERRLRSLPDRHGVAHRWEATFNPVMDDTGRVTHVVEVWRDISERSQLEGQLAHSERLASIGTLAAGVGHEINNPLASVLMAAESLHRWVQRRDFSDASLAEAIETLEIIEKETRRGRETTDKLMLLAHPAAGVATLVSLNTVVQDTLSLLQFEMRKLRIDTLTELDPDLPDVWAREGAMRGLCMNLMLNAVQAMASTGGTLAMRTFPTEAGVGLVVEDTGPGIAPEAMAHIWDAFFTTKPVGQGTGLGLTITQRVVARHGGTIRAENRPEGGARFVVELPVQGPGGDGV